MTKFLKSTLIRNRFKSNLIKNLRSRKNIINNSKSSFTKINDKKREIPDQQDIGKEMPTNKSIKSIRRSEKFKEKKEKEVLIPQMSLESLKDHYYTFNLITELYSILYTTLIFKWIQTDRILILVNDNKEGYRLEIFLKSFKINCCLLDNEMPINTNNHFANNFIKGNFQICISNKAFAHPSPDFVDKMIENSPIPISLIYFNFLDAKLLNNQCFRLNIKSIHHFITFENKNKFSIEYNDLNENISFMEYEYNKEQVAHLRYRCEDNYHTIKKSDIKKAKTKKINQELLHSKDMEKYFENHPEEKLNIINAIKENNYYTIKSSATYLPSYLIHEDSKENKIEKAILNNYGNDPNKVQNQKNSNQRRKRKSKMQEYLECLDRNDGTENNIKF